MILQQTPDRILAIKQPDHAAFAAFLLEHWSGHNFAHDPDRAAIIIATRDHDFGWTDFEARPRLDPATGLPVSFQEATPEESMAIWRRAVERHLTSSPFIALLITHHAYSIHELTHKREAPWKAYMTEFARLRAELRTQLGLEHPDVERAYSFLRMADWFSLAYCMHAIIGAERPEQYAGFQFRREGNELQFKPYPLDVRGLHYRLPVHRLAPAGYRSVEALLEDLAVPEFEDVVINPMGRLR